MQRNARVAYMFLAPALILMMVFVVVPVAASFVISLTDFNIFALADWSNARFIGVDNYIRLFQDELFWKPGKPCTSLRWGCLLQRLALILNASFPLNRAKDLFRWDTTFQHY